MQLSAVTDGWKSVPLMSARVIPNPLFPVGFGEQTVLGRSFANRFTRVGASLDDAIAAAARIAQRFDPLDPKTVYSVNGAAAVLQGVDGAFYVTRIGATLDRTGSRTSFVRLPIDGRLKMEGQPSVDLREVFNVAAIEGKHPDLRAVVGADFVLHF